MRSSLTRPVGYGLLHFRAARVEGRVFGDWAMCQELTKIVQKPMQSQRQIPNKLRRIVDNIRPCDPAGIETIA